MVVVNFINCFIFIGQRLFILTSKVKPIANDGESAQDDIFGETKKKAQLDTIGTATTYTATSNGYYHLDMLQER